ncbi:MAG: hypothetical protein AB7E37_02085 [Candidatus Altimarinota bacterium]
METLDILYITLTFFTIVIGTLFSIVLYKLIKVLNVLMEIIEIYNKAKQVMALYAQIPDIIFDYLKGMLFSKKDK